MPIYEYKCPNCSNEYTDRIHEVLMNISEREDEVICPDCGTKLERLISASNWVIH